MCQHLRRRHLTPAPLTLRLQFSQPGLYLIRHRRIEQVFHDHMPPLNESNQEPVSEKVHFSAVNRLNIRIGAVSKLTLYGTATLFPGWPTVWKTFRFASDPRSQLRLRHSAQALYF